MKRLGLCMLVAALLSCNTNLHDKSLERLEEPARPTRVFVFDPANAAEYPICHTSFINAIHAWANVLPIHFVVTYDTRVWGVRVWYTDIDESFGNDKAAGIWLEQYYIDMFNYVPLIAIDADDLELDTRKTKLGNYATNTAIHEIGHMLGLGHVHGPGSAFHEGITVVSKELARICIMSVANHPDQEIRPFEIALAREILNIPKELEHHKGYVTIFMPKEPADVDGGISDSSPEPK